LVRKRRLGLLILSFVLIGTSTPYTHAQRLVDVGDGRRMNIYCTGTGSPVVILDAGGGESTRTWRYVQPKVAAFTRVCSYDRAGIGFSDPGPLPRTTAAIVADLHALLTAAGEKPPYVLVGHSMGGYDALLYADTYLPEVAGMVLVDTSSVDQDARLTAILPRLNSFDKAQLSALQACSSDPKCADAASELANTHAADIAELKRAQRSYGNMPLIVLTGGAQFKRYQKLLGATDAQVLAAQNAWTSMHQDIAKLSTRGVSQQVAGAGHDIQLERPGAVVTAIRDVVRESAALFRTKRHELGAKLCKRGPGDGIPNDPMVDALVVVAKAVA
jgi:pimeloyl-ACP methyl ester carboxylesterase